MFLLYLVKRFVAVNAPENVTVVQWCNDSIVTCGGYWNSPAIFSSGKKRISV